MWYFSASHFFFQYPPIDAKPAEVDLKEDFEDTKEAIRFRISQEEQTAQWPKEKVPKGKQQSTKLKIEI